ncbi:MAG: MOP flippase family protein, partial [Elusimicrobia bacterium]|nr:MOP flippase family protein [Elusimicrobiota bacterium]
PELKGYLFLASFLFLVIPTYQLFITLLRKQLLLKHAAIVAITGMITYGIATISFAVAGFGVVSIILGQLLQNLCMLILLLCIFRTHWLPRFHFQFKEIRSYISFGIYQMGERIINFSSSYIDYIIIGRFLGPRALGFYTLAYQIMIFPLTKVNPVITRVAFPAFAIIQDNTMRLRDGYCKGLTYISLLTLPMLIGMFAVAPEFIRLFYGSQWEPSIILLQIFSLIGIFLSLGNPVGSLLLAKGRADIGFYWNVFKIIVIITALIIGSRWGITGIATARLISIIPLFFIIQTIVNRFVDLSYQQIMRAIAIPVFATLIMYCGIIGFRQITAHFSLAIEFTLTIILGCLLYFIAILVLKKSLLQEIRSFIIDSL